MAKASLIFGKILPPAVRRLLGAKPRAAQAGCTSLDSYDTMLVSYPRSGNTWMRYLLANLLMPEGEWNITNIGRIVPDIHEDAPQDPVQTRPRIAKSHEAFRSEYRRVIYLYRDGRDVAVSYYDFQKKLQGNQDNFSTFLANMLQGRLPYGSWQDHVASWLFADRAVRLLPVCYETLHADTRSELERIRSFLGCEWSVTDIQTAITKSTFEEFQRHYSQYKQNTHWSKGFTGGVKGGPGKWREVFDNKLNELFWQHAGEVAQRLGYPEE